MDHRIEFDPKQGTKYKDEEINARVLSQATINQVHFGPLNQIMFQIQVQNK